MPPYTPPFYTPGAGCTVSCRAVTSLHLPRASKIFKGNCGVAKIQPTVQEQQHQRRYSEGREPADGADAAARGGEAGAEVSGASLPPAVLRCSRSYFAPAGTQTCRARSGRERKWGAGSDGAAAGNDTSDAAHSERFKAAPSGSLAGRYKSKWGTSVPYIAPSMAADCMSVARTALSRSTSVSSRCQRALPCPKPTRRWRGKRYWRASRLEWRPSGGIPQQRTAAGSGR